MAIQIFTVESSFFQNIVLKLFYIHIQIFF
jgi:hypothetical protein